MNLALLTLQHVLDEDRSDGLIDSATAPAHQLLYRSVICTLPRTTSWSTLNSSLSAEVSLTCFDSVPEAPAAGALVDAAAASDMVRGVLSAVVVV